MTALRAARLSVIVLATLFMTSFVRQQYSAYSKPFDARECNIENAQENHIAQARMAKLIEIAESRQDEIALGSR